MKFGYLIVALLIVQPAFASPQTYTVAVSKDLHGEVYLEKPDEVFSPGRITLYDTKSGKPLIRVDSDELAFSLRSDKPLPNGKEVPLDDQDVIIYQDVNFDGTADLAIMNGQESCYHGPSYQVFLAESGRVDRFNLSGEFTSLATDYCGMFGIDAAAQEITTIAKSGCCWHQYTTFKLIAGTPKAVQITEEDGAGLPYFSTETQSNWDGREMVTTRETTLELAEEDEARVFSFKVKNKNANVVLFSLGDTLTYAFVNEDGRVELMYPDHTQRAVDDAASSSFTLARTNQQRTLSFGNKSTRYTVYQNESTGAAGILIETAGRSYDWKAIPGTAKGSLDFDNKRFENVHAN